MTDRRLAVDAWEALFRAQHEVFEQISIDFQDAELSQAEYDVLLTVTRCADLSARLREVTANMLISQPSVSRLVDRMVARGLLTKGADPNDGRGAVVHATPEGTALFRRIASKHGQSIAARMSVLDDDELRRLRDLATKLRDH